MANFMRSMLALMLGPLIIIGLIIRIILMALAFGWVYGEQVADWLGGSE